MQWVLVFVCLLNQTGLAATFYVPPYLVEEQVEKVKAVRLNPQSAEARFELAMNYAYTGWVELGWDQLKLVPEYDKNYAQVVIQKYSEKIRKEPNEWRHYFKRAFGYYFEDQKEKSMDQFKKVVELNPKQVWAMGFVAYLYGEKKEFKQGMDWCKRALEIEPNATAIHMLMAAALLQTGDYFGFLGEPWHVTRLKSAEAKYRPIPPD